MIDWQAVGAAAPAIAVAVTLILFVVESRRRARRDRMSLRHEAVSQILTTMERSIRSNQGIFSSLRFWANRDLEYTLAVPRLLHDLGPQNRRVAEWAATRIQAMLIAKSDSDASTIGLQMCVQLVEWDQGSVQASWFDGEMGKTPIARDFHIPWKSSIVRAIGRTKESTIALGVVALLAWMLSNIGRQLLLIGAPSRHLTSSHGKRKRTNPLARSRG